MTFKRSKDSPFYDFVEKLKKELPPDDQARFSSRKGWSSPFVWLEMPDGSRHALGGRDDLCDWAIKEFSTNKKLVRTAQTPAKDSDAILVSLSKPGNAMPPGMRVPTKV